MRKSFSGIILAGGTNKRFNGIFKSNMVVDGETIISRIINTIKDLFDEIIIVTNTPEEFKEHKNYKIVRDQILKVGPLGGIHSALQTSEKDAAFVFAGDMPLLDKEFIVRHMDAYNNCQCDVLMPRIKDNLEPLHAIYSISILDTLEEYLASDNDYAVREFLKRVNVKYFEVKDSERTRNIFTNINSPEDMLLIERMLGVD